MVRLLQLSDTHLLGPSSVSPHPEIDPEARLVAVLEALQDQGPFDAVVLSGDIADDASPEAVRRVHELVQPLAPLVVAAPGNHDDTDVVARVFGAEPVRVGTWTICPVATNRPGEVAGQGQPLMDLLSYCGGPTVVVMHHPVRSRSTHPWFVLAGVAEAEQRLSEHDHPLVLLSGHLHQAYEGAIGHVRLYGAPATFYGIAHDGADWTPNGAPTGASIIELADDGSSRIHHVFA